MNIKIALACVLATQGLRLVNSVDENLPVEVVKLGKFGTQYNGLVAALGATKKSSTQKATFQVDIGQATSIIGEKTKAKWGIDCSSSADNSCVVTDETQNTIFYNSLMLKVQQAQLYARLDQNADLDVNDPKVDKININLVVGGNKWSFDDWGVLGLSPSGSFAQFMTQAYGKNATMLLRYEAKSVTEQNEKLDFDLRAYINPRFNDTEVAASFELDSKAPNWSAIADIDFISPIWSFKSQKVCFNTIANEVIQVGDSIDRCDAVRSLICEGKIGPDCTKSNSDFKKAPDLAININGVTFKFLPEEYLFYDGEKVACRFGDVSDLRTNDSCDEDVELGVGRLFFQKYIPVFKFDSGAKSALTLLNHYSEPDSKPSKSRLLWLIVGGIAALIALIVIVSVILKKKQESDDDYYSSYQPNE